MTAKWNGAERRAQPPEDTLRKIMKESVYETLSGLGFDTENAHGMQEDMAFLRNMREGSQEMKRTIKRSIVTVVIPATLYILWESLKSKLK
jgi:hypothetical protein